MNALNITAVILAGGRASRMQGQDKGLIKLGDKTLIEHVITCLLPQVQTIVISANRNLENYRGFGLPVLSDPTQEYLGPLSGIATAMQQCKTDYLLVVPCDCPYLPSDLATRMLSTITQTETDACLAHDGQRLQPLVALLSVSLLNDLKGNIAAGHLKVERWMLEQSHCLVEFNDKRAFFNINTEEELQQAKRLLST